MPIEGDLKSINLPSVLQLIAQERLTGIFKVKQRNAIVNVGFVEGHVAGAFFERGEKAESLETYLVKSGVIKKNLFEMVEEIHRETRRPMMNILLEDKYITLEEVERIIKFKIQEVLDEIFSWDEGEFKFEEGDVMYPKSMIKIRMSTESLILESARRSDEWPRITNIITSGDFVYRKVQNPDLKLKPQEAEERVLSLIDGHRSVNDIVAISGLGKFHSYSCIYHLLSIGLIELAYSKPAPVVVKPEKKISLKFLIMPLIITAVVAVIILELLIGNYFAQRQTFSLNIIREEIYELDYTPHRKIFYYQHNRIPSIEEIRNIFEQ
ncbi:MAG: DUF4388 domain-containing protein [candidate division WOR-3 bacterium]|nr:MAG: DUF4388 domain-containing protein [candidate division WOR-3 bacterium]